MIEAKVRFGLIGVAVGLFPGGFVDWMEEPSIAKWGAMSINSLPKRSYKGASCEAKRLI